MEIKIGIKDGSIEVSSGPVGQLTNSNHKDFYVYEWNIKQTGEIFYVGKGRGDRYKEYHSRAYEAEKIRQAYETDVRFVAKNLTEEQAIELETQEMIRILNETSDLLTNRITPLFVKRDNGYGRCKNTPKLEFEKAPCFYACEIDEHYFGIKHRAFDPVKYDSLKCVYFIEKSISADVLEIVYGGKVDKYYDETVFMLETNGNKILKSKYAKSVTAWIYTDDDYVTNYYIDQEQALKKLGRNIPAYHLIDVWKLLKRVYGEPKVTDTLPLAIKPKHNRVPLEEIKNLNDWEKGYDEGHVCWVQGEECRKSGDLEKAIKLFDKARYNGYDAPALYDSYAKTFRRLEDYENEIAILDEAIARLGTATKQHTILIKWKEQRKKAAIKILKN